MVLLNCIAIQRERERENILFTSLTSRVEGRLLSLNAVVCGPALCSVLVNK